MGFQFSDTFDDVPAPASHPEPPAPPREDATDGTAQSRATVPAGVVSDSPSPRPGVSEIRVFDRPGSEATEAFTGQPDDLFVAPPAASVVRGRTVPDSIALQAFSGDNHAVAHGGNVGDSRSTGTQGGGVFDDAFTEVPPAAAAVGAGGVFFDSEYGNDAEYSDADVADDESAMSPKELRREQKRQKKEDRARERQEAANRKQAQRDAAKQEAAEAEERKRAEKVEQAERKRQRRTEKKAAAAPVAESRPESRPARRPVNDRSAGTSPEGAGPKKRSGVKAAAALVAVLVLIGGVAKVSMDKFGSDGTVNTADSDSDSDAEINEAVSESDQTTAADEEAPAAEPDPDDIFADEVSAKCQEGSRDGVTTTRSDGSTKSATQVIAAWEHAYYVTRSGSVAMSYLTGSAAEANTATALQDGIDSSLADDYCIEMTPFGGNVTKVKITEFTKTSDGTAKESVSEQKITTKNTNDVWKISAINF